MLRIFKQYYPIRNLFFVLGEAGLIYLSLMAGRWVMMGEAMSLSGVLQLKMLMVTLVCLTCLYYNDLYDLAVIDSFSELAIHLLQAMGAASFLLAFAYLVHPQIVVRTDVFMVSMGIVFVLISTWRFFYKRLLDSGTFDQRIIVLGSGGLAQDILSEIAGRKDCGYSVVAVVPETFGENQPPAKGKRPPLVRNDFDGLSDLSRELRVKKVVVALKEKRARFPIRELLNCRIAGIDILEGNSFFEMLSGKLYVEQLNPSWLIFSQGFYRSRIQGVFKRTGDLLLSLCMLIVLSPLIGLTAAAIKVDSRGAAIFSQERIGRGRRPYMLHKFRSMVADAEKFSGPVWAQDEDPRITRVGRFIRKWRIDELPQLWNVLKGEMSFVGPRPERDFFIRQLEERIPFYAERFTAKPGLTGWAQVSYGYGASVEDAIEKLNYDLFYIKNMSFLMDAMIVLRTIKIVIFGKGR